MWKIIAAILGDPAKIWNEPRAKNRAPKRNKCQLVMLHLCKNSIRLIFEDNCKNQVYLPECQ